MTRRKKKPNRASKDNPGRSKYAQKIQRRRRICRQLEIPDTPFPVLEAEDESMS